MAYKVKNGIVEDAVLGAANEYAEAPLGWDAIITIAADATTTGQSLVDVTGMTYAVVHAATYEIEADLLTVASADTNGMEVGINVTQTPVTVEATVTANTTTTTVTSQGIQANATATGAVNTSSAGKGHIHIKGFVTTHATLDGTLSIQHLKATSGTSTVKAGSTLKVRRLV